jgi:hypothetical protein
MAVSFPLSGLQLHSQIKKSGELEVSLATVDVPSEVPHRWNCFVPRAPHTHAIRLWRVSMPS